MSRNKSYKVFQNEKIKIPNKKVHKKSMKTDISSKVVSIIKERSKPKKSEKMLKKNKNKSYN